MITIATAECFTHGFIAHELHVLAQGYKDKFGSNFEDLINSIIQDYVEDKSDINKKSNSEYNSQYNSEYNSENELSTFNFDDLSVISGMFIPTLTAVYNILKIKDPIEPISLIKDIKVYNTDDDRKMAIKMAEAVRNLSCSDIGIGTTAGIGYGGIAIVDKDMIIVTSSDVYANLIECKSDDLYNRQINAIKKTLRIFIYYLNKDFEKINSLNNVEIIYK